MSRLEPLKAPLEEDCRLQPEFLPATSLYGDGEAVGWELSPKPFPITLKQYQEIQRLGETLWRFLQAIDQLYRDSLKGTAPSWIAQVLDQGKPHALLRYGQMKRFKKDFPLVLRPDLLITEAGWALCEIDAVPGGLGFLSALNQAYRRSGFSVVEPEETLPIAFLNLLKAQLPDHPNPVIAILLSDEAADYRAEMRWLAEQIQVHYPHFYLLHPKDIELVRDRLVFQPEPGGVELQIDLIYRFFELFDLPNIPKMELIQYAVKKGWVRCTAPFKPWLEEKSPLAMIHHPMLKPFWKKALGESAFQDLKAYIPHGWILDPTPLPPQAVIPDLTIGSRSFQAFDALKELSQKERELILKPSGFSPLSWGARGVTAGHDVSKEIWTQRLSEALASYETTPYLLQRFEKPITLPIQRMPAQNNQAPEAFSARTRLCPYFFVRDNIPQLVGILATACPADKKIIHGMKDAILAPCQVYLEELGKKF